MKFFLMYMYPQGAPCPLPKGDAAPEPSPRRGRDGPAPGHDAVWGWWKMAVSTDGSLARRRGTLSCLEHISEGAREEIATGICHSNFSKAPSV